MKIYECFFSKHPIKVNLSSQRKQIPKLPALKCIHIHVMHYCCLVV